MVLSMTGYGRAHRLLAGRDITVEIKSVNHRYFEYTSRLPRAYSFLDDEIKKRLAAAFSRGEVEVALLVQNAGAKESEIRVNMDTASGYLSALRTMAKELGVQDDVSAATLARFGDIFSQVKPAESEEEAKEAVLSVLEEALGTFLQMRGAEGEKLREDILARLDTVEKLVQEVEQNSAGRVEAYRERLYQRLRTVLEDQNIEEARILQEAAIYADKTAVDEETVRLHSHIRQYRQILDGPSPMGKKLDFLTQELNREVNTIGSKAGDLSITRLVVDMKNEIEKIREQIQNIE